MREKCYKYIKNNIQNELNRLLSSQSVSIPKSWEEYVIKSKKKTDYSKVLTNENNIKKNPVIVTTTKQPFQKKPLDNGYENKNVYTEKLAIEIKDKNIFHDNDRVFIIY